MDDAFEIVIDDVDPVWHLRRYGNRLSMCQRPTHAPQDPVSLRRWGDDQIILKRMTWCAECERLVPPQEKKPWGFL